MTKTELLASLQAMSFVNSIMETTNLNVAEANGAARYRVDYFEVVGNVAQASSAQFYVINEGQENEISYWFQKAPVQTLGA